MNASDDYFRSEEITRLEKLKRYYDKKTQAQFKNMDDV